MGESNHFLLLMSNLWIKTGVSAEISEEGARRTVTDAQKPGELNCILMRSAGACWEGPTEDKKPLSLSPWKQVSSFCVHVPSGGKEVRRRQIAWKAEQWSKQDETGLKWILKLEDLGALNRPALIYLLALSARETRNNSFLELICFAQLLGVVRVTRSVQENRERYIIVHAWIVVHTFKPCYT